MDKFFTRRPRAAVRSETYDWGDIHTGTREDLLAAGLLLEEWIPPPIKVRKNRRVEMRLPDGRSVKVYTKGARLEVRIKAAPEESDCLSLDDARRELARIFALPRP